MVTNKDLAAQRERLLAQAREHLLQVLQPGNPRAFAHGNPRANLNHRSPYSTPNQGLSFQSGRMPNLKEIEAFAMQNPKYRAVVRKLEQGRGKSQSSASSAGSAAGGPVVDPSQPTAAQGLYDAYLASQQRGFDEAKAENLARWHEGKGELTDARDFSQEKYANFGEAAQQDIDELMQEALSNARANAASRGLSNSNVTDAYALRVARDTAREQQRVRETRDTRMADAYSRDTGNLVGFIERREDPYPDMNQALQLGIQLASSEADRQAQAARTAAMRRAYRGGGGGRGRIGARLPPITGPQGGVAPAFLNGTPVQQANVAFSNYGPLPLRGSNRYPTRRSPEEYAAIQQQQAIEMQRHQMLPTYRRPVPQLQIPGGPPQGVGPYFA